MSSFLSPCFGYAPSRNTDSYRRYAVAPPWRGEIKTTPFLSIPGSLILVTNVSLFALRRGPEGRHLFLLSGRVGCIVVNRSCPDSDSTVNRPPFPEIQSRKM